MASLSTRDLNPTLGTAFAEYAIPKFALLVLTGNKHPNVLETTNFACGDIERRCAFISNPALLGLLRVPRIGVCFLDEISAHST